MQVARMKLAKARLNHEGHEGARRKELTQT
jgi:hypothetical protein